MAGWPRSRTHTLAPTLLLVLLIGTACRRNGAAPATASPPASPAVSTDATVAHGDDVAWFTGTVDEAFAAAARERKPLFLYWGAVWCPPCHALRQRIFPLPQIRARLDAAVAVYLDGDTERAQIWGERLETSGYPTVIVFDPDGHEIARMPSLLPVDDYAELLAAALDAARPLAERIAEAERLGPTGLPAADLRLLAFHAWNQDGTSGLDADGRRRLFERFWRETPPTDPLVRSRFLSLWLSERADLPADAAADPIAPELRRDALAELSALLADPVQRRTNLDLVLYGASDLVKLVVPEAGPERDRLVATWLAAARALETDPELGPLEQVVALRPQLQLAVLDRPADAPVPEPLLAHLRDRIEATAGAISDPEAMQAAMNTLAGLLEEAGLPDEAATLIERHLGETSASYYYVGWLAGLAAEAGRAEEAVTLYRRAWQEARTAGGPRSMTAFRWGSGYLRRALSLAPGGLDAIATDGAAVLADLLSGPDAFAGGNRSRLQTVLTSLETWRAGDPEARTPIVAALRQRVVDACAARPAAEDATASACRELLAQPSAG